MLFAGRRYAMYPLAPPGAPRPSSMRIAFISDANIVANLIEKLEIDSVLGLSDHPTRLWRVFSVCLTLPSARRTRPTTRGVLYARRQIQQVCSIYARRKPLALSPLALSYHLAAQSPSLHVGGSVHRGAVCSRAAIGRLVLASGPHTGKTNVPLYCRAQCQLQVFRESH